MVNLGSAYGEILIGTDQANRNVQSLAQQMQSVGKTLSLAVSAPLLGVAGAALQSAGDFEQSLNQMQVVSSATGAQMQALQASALQLGAQTSFSAGEAAQGMLELSKAGLTAEETMQAISGVLDLAAAGGLGVGQAAEITANAVNAFGLAAGDANRVANLLAAAANSSSVEVTDMAQAFQMSASVFGANQVPIDQLAASIAILGNNGLKGSDAGTSMKTMLMRLTAPTKEAGKEMAALGLQVYNADGSMRNFQDIVADLGTVTANLSDEQRNAALTTIFGADAIRAANILVKEGADEFTNMMTAVNKTGAATEVADARMKGFRGAIEYIKGSIDSFLIGTALPFLDSLSGIVRTVADAISAFGELPEPVRNAALAFLGVLAAAGPILLALSGVGAVLGALLSPLGLVVVGVGALAAAFAGDWGGVRTLTMNLANYIGTVLDAGAGSIEAGEALGLLPAPLQGIAAVIGGAVAGVQSLWNAFTNLYAVLVDAGPLSIEASEALGLFPAALQPIIGWGLAAWGALQNFVAVVQDAGLTSLEAQEALGLFPAGLQTLVGAFVAAWPAISSAIQTAWATTSATLTQLWTWLTVTLPAGLTALQGWWSAAWTALPAAVSAAQATLTTVFAALQGAWGQVAAFFGPSLMRLGAGVAQFFTGFSGLGTEFVAFWQALQPIIAAVMTGLVMQMQGTLAIVSVLWVTAVNFLAATFQNLAPVLGAVVNEITLILNTIYTGFSATINLIKGIVTGDWSLAWQSLLTIAQATVGLFAGTLTNLWTMVTSIFTIIRTTITTTLTDLGVDLDATMQAISASWAAAWSAVSTTVTGVFASIAARWTAFGAWLSSAASAAMNAVQATWATAWSAIYTGATGFFATVMAGWTAFGSWLSGVVSSTMASVQAAWSAAWGVLGTAVGGAVAAVAVALAPLAETAGQAVALVSAAISGDWATAWQAAQTIVSNVMAFIQTSLGNGLLAVSTIFALIGATISSALANLGFEGAAAAAQGVIDRIVSLTEWLGKLVSGDISLNIVAPAWIGALFDWQWPDFITQPEWAAALVDWAWPDFISVPAWVKTLLDWAWPDFITQPEWVAILLGWLWPAFIGQPSWVGTLFDWTWPAFDMPDWLNQLFNWTWPSLPELPSWLGGAGSKANASGTSYFSGGRTALNERGRELIALPVEQSILPAGSQVLTNGQSNRLLAAGAGGGNIHVHLDGIVIQNEQDVAALGWRLGNYARRAAGR